MYESKNKWKIKMVSFPFLHNMIDMLTFHLIESECKWTVKRVAPYLSLPTREASHNMLGIITFHLTESKSKWHCKKAQLSFPLSHRIVCLSLLPSIVIESESKCKALRGSVSHSLFSLSLSLPLELSPNLLDITHYQTTNSGLFQTERVSRRHFKFHKNERKLSKQVENAVGKGEIARYEQFLLFPQCFQKACFPGASKGVSVGMG